MPDFLSNFLLAHFRKFHFFGLPAADLSSQDGILGDEPDLAHHLQRVEDVDGAAGDGCAGGERLHGAGGTLDAQD